MFDNIKAIIGSGFRLWDTAKVGIVRASFVVRQMVALIICGVVSGFRIWGVYEVKCFGPDGVLKWTAIAPNLIVNVGLNYILNIALGGGTQITVWYMGLVDAAGFTAFAAADTHASHAGWVEVTAYSQSTRVAWTPGTSSAQSIVNSSSANFSINATKTVKGLFLSNDSTKGGTSGASTLFSEAAFSGGNQTGNSGDTFQVTYNVNAASS